ncbi:MAG: 3-dehydroquinate synthase, partial [Gemmatimonadota bacterium]
SITDQMLDSGLGRDTTVVALGGGVVGDLAGFVAATFLRGVPYIQAPTSLLAMIDASVGGKTGVDTSHGKNLVGAFCQPAVVIADVSTLATLPPGHVSAGMAEAIKHGVIQDAAYFRHIVEQAGRILERESDAIIDVVRRSVEIKADVVSEDEREQGRRAILNFGHTIGHALEAVSEYGLLHGEAVALGMTAEVKLGCKLGITDTAVIPELQTAISALSLPSEINPPLDPDALLAAMAQDKKNRAGAVTFALPARLGSMARGPDGSWTQSVPKQVITEALAP